MTARPEDVSPTAYATSWLWYRNGLSHPALAPPEGRRIDRGFRALIAGTRLLSGVSLEAMMLARHRGIDAVLERAIADGRITQVIELAAGLSARGWRIKQRHPALVYVETDLPAMAATKRSLLAGATLLSANHRVAELDVLRADGAGSLAAVAATLDPGRGLAIITEGLMNYLAPEDADGVWRRIAAALGGFAHGLYLADVYPRDLRNGAAMTVFGAAIQAFVRGRMHQHFQKPDDVVRRMRASGFAKVQVHETRDIAEIRDVAAIRGAERVRVLETWTAARSSRA